MALLTDAITPLASAGLNTSAFPLPIYGQITCWKAKETLNHLMKKKT
jgi:hypothetical protein